MELKAGDEVTFRFIPGNDFYQGTIVVINEQALSLRSYGKLPKDMEAGWHLAIPESQYSDFEIYAEILEIKGDLLSLKRLWMGKRAYLRVDDFFPATASKISSGTSLRPPRMLYPKEANAAPEVIAGSSPESMAEMLVTINLNMEYLITKMYLDSQCAPAKGIAVNISASGAKFVVADKVAAGDDMEIKMALPVYPPVIFTAHGEVVRTKYLGEGRYEAGLRFLCMDDYTTDALLQYTFKRQYDLNMMKRERDADRKSS